MCDTDIPSVQPTPASTDGRSISTYRIILLYYYTIANLADNRPKHGASVLAVMTDHVVIATMPVL